MSRSPFDLTKDALASLDEFGNRVFIYPAAVNGLWHRRRLYFQVFLLFIFLAIPWIKINGHPAILLNLPERQFAIFGLTFWAHDGPMIFFVLATGALSLALVTAIWGRVWCGWACPQTVFIEQVYRRVETWIEGSHLERRKLNEGLLTFKKAFKKGSKWLAFGVLSWAIGNTFLMYFVGSDRWLQMIQSPPLENWTSFLVMGFVTAVVWFDFGWFREQFCIIMCPYGRFQSVLMDRNSKAVIYDHNRGEPRKGSPEFAKKKGDCVNCYRCVAVCPTAIDIRRGIQMECIACTACMDACDEVMTKVGKPTGLIRYGSEIELTGKAARQARPKTVIFGTLLAAVVAGLLFVLSTHEQIDITVLRAVDTPFREVPLKNGEPGLVNHFQLAIQNHDFNDILVRLTAPHAPEGLRIVTPSPELLLAAGKTSRTHIFFEFPRSLTAGSERFDLDLNIEIDHLEPTIPTASGTLSTPGPDSANPSAPRKVIQRETRPAKVRLVGPR